jgi:hypothetical protein
MIFNVPQMILKLGCEKVKLDLTRDAFPPPPKKKESKIDKRWKMRGSLPQKMSLESKLFTRITRKLIKVFFFAFEPSIFNF